MIHTTRTRCNGRCHDKCVVINYPQGNWYKDLKPEDVTIFIDSLLDNKDYTGKISHSYNNHGFDRSPEVVTGIRKEPDKVKKCQNDVRKIMVIRKKVNTSHAGSYLSSGYIRSLSS